MSLKKACICTERLLIALRTSKIYERSYKNVLITNQLKVFNVPSKGTGWGISKKSQRSTKEFAIISGGRMRIRSSDA